MNTYYHDELQLQMLEAIYPHLKELISRYRLLQALYPEALYEFDERMRKLGLWREDVSNDKELSYLKTNLELIEEELGSASRQIQAILQAELPESR